MNSRQMRARLVQAGAAFSAAALIAGCGSAYRPVVTPINSTGPAAQPSSYAVVVSSPSVTAPGVATIIDYSGDTVMAQATIGVGPVTFTMDQSGSTGYTVNSDGTLSNFPISTSLQTKNVTVSTLAAPSKTSPCLTESTCLTGLFSPSGGLWTTDLTGVNGQPGSNVDVFTGSPANFKLAIPVAATPIMVVGSGSIGQRNYVVSQVVDSNGVDCNNSPSTVALNGLVTPIEVSTDTADPAIVLDPANPTNASTGTKNAMCPVFAIPNSNGSRMFVLNRGSDTISVINVQNNILDTCTGLINLSGQPVTCHPILPLSTNAVSATGVTPLNGTSGMKATAGPVYAEYVAATSQLVVANYDGSSISIIDVSMDEYGNDGPTFGTTYTVPVGNNPASVTVLADGSRAYTANQTDGTVSIVNLSSHTIEKAALPVVGNPRTVVSTQNSEFGKVYVSSPNSPFLTIISTVTDLVDTTVLVEGDILDVRTTSQNGSSGNAEIVSRKPGYGQPCYLPPSLLGATATLSGCQTLP